MFRVVNSTALRGNLFRHVTARSTRAFAATPVGNNRTPEQRATDPEFADDSFHAAKEAWKQQQKEGGDKKKPVGPIARVLWFFPGLFTAGLGIWQLQRREWKLDLIKRRKDAKVAPPRHLDAVPSTKAWDDMEWSKVSFTGEFEHDKEVYLSPRWFKEERDVNGGISEVGLHVCAPFRLQNGDYVLVNRGWVPRDGRNPQRRVKGQVTGTVTVEGIARATEVPGTFTPENNPEKNEFHWLDLEAISKLTGCGSKSEPLVVLDAMTQVEGGPVANQTPDKWRNEHLNYAMTWFGLSAATTAMAYVRIFR